MHPPVTKYWTSVLTIVSVTLVLMLLVGCASVTLQGQAQSSPSATTTLLPTATSATSIHMPTLGSTTTDFLVRYQVVAGTQNLVYDATIAGQKVEIALGPDLPNQSRDGIAHVAVVTVDVPADALSVEHWNEALADQVAQAFLPGDAQFQRIVTVHGARDHIYTSASIAATFTPDQFVTDGNTPVPVGTFDYLCNPLPLSNTGYEQCTIAIGAN